MFFVYLTGNYINIIGPFKKYLIVIECSVLSDWNITLTLLAHLRNQLTKRGKMKLLLFYWSVRF
jgi:hypothetical protein